MHSIQVLLVVVVVVEIKKEDSNDLTCVLMEKRLNMLNILSALAKFYNESVFDVNFFGNGFCEK